ncbi:MAG: hypothetical protein Q8P84_01430, partial [Deltaproteobacteria bacterium]|nr:hypothetical protein [Deltaproteobacteria bacterium]
PVLAIQWIHLTNGRYEVVRKAQMASLSVSFFIIFFRVLYGFIRSLLLSFQLFFLQFYCRAVLKKLCDKEFDALSKTWGYPQSSLKRGEDFYLGDMAWRLKEKKISLLTLCGNAKEKHWRPFLDSHKSDSFPFQLPELCLVKVRDIFVVWFQQCLAGFSLFFGALGEKKKELRPFLLFAGMESLRHLTLRNALFYFIGKNACTFWKPKFFVSLYEGHAWEKCLWKGIRKGLPSCRIVAYQHTVVFQRTLALRNPAYNSALTGPDVVLCTGPETAKIIRKGHESNGSTLIPFGSFRFKDSDADLREPSPERKTVLVLPEGLMGESQILFHAAIRLAKRLKDYRFIFRTHPILPFDKVRLHLEEDVTLWNNIEISKEKDIAKDFERSSVLLYRGSSSVLYGVLKGLKPFYFGQEGEETIDPLFELSEFRECVLSTDDLAEKLTQYQKIQRDAVLPSWQKAAKYVQEYTMPVRTDSVRELLEAVNR